MAFGGCCEFRRVLWHSGEGWHLRATVRMDHSPGCRPTKTGGAQSTRTDGNHLHEAEVAAHNRSEWRLGVAQCIYTCVQVESRSRSRI